MSVRARGENSRGKPVVKRLRCFDDEHLTQRVNSARLDDTALIVRIPAACSAGCVNLYCKNLSLSTAHDYVSLLLLSSLAATAKLALAPFHSSDFADSGNRFRLPSDPATEISLNG